MNFVELNVVQCLKDPCLSHFQFIVNPRCVGAASHTSCFLLKLTIYWKCLFLGVNKHVWTHWWHIRLITITAVAVFLIVNLWLFFRGTRKISEVWSFSNIMDLISDIIGRGIWDRQHSALTFRYTLGSLDNLPCREQHPLMFSFKKKSFYVLFWFFLCDQLTLK